MRRIGGPITLRAHVTVAGRRLQRPEELPAIGINLLEMDGVVCRHARGSPPVTCEHWSLLVSYLLANSGFTPGRCSSATPAAPGRSPQQRISGKCVSVRKCRRWPDAHYAHQRFHPIRRRAAHTLAVRTGDPLRSGSRGSFRATTACRARRLDQSPTPRVVVVAPETAIQTAQAAMD